MKILWSTPWFWGVFMWACGDLVKAQQEQEQEPAEPPAAQVEHTTTIVVRGHRRAAKALEPQGTQLLQDHAQTVDVAVELAPLVHNQKIDEVLAEHGLATPGASSSPDLMVSVQMRGHVTGAEVGSGLGTSRLYLGMHPDIGRRFVRDLFTVHSVHILQGPDATLAGMGSPAGILQYVPKLAVANTPSKVSLGHNTQGLGRIAVDLSLPLSPTPQDGSKSAVRTRLIAVAQRGEKSVEGVATDRDLVYWTNRYQDEHQILDASIEQQRNQQPFSFGTVFANGQWQFDKSYVDIQRASAMRQAQRATLHYQRALTPALKLDAWHNHVRTQRDEKLVGFYAVVSPTELSGYYRTIDESTRQRNQGAMLSGQYRWADAPKSLLWPVQHDWQLRWQNNMQSLRFSGPQNVNGFQINIDDPDFSSAVLDGLTMSPRWWHDDMRDTTFSVQDTLSWRKHWKLQVALSRSSVRIDSASARTAAPPASLNTVTDTHWLGRSAHLTYSPPAYTLGLHHSQGYEPNRGLQRDGSHLPARYTTQWELAWRQKADPLHEESSQKGWLWHASLWQNQQTHVAGPDPLDKNYLAPIGTVAGQGLVLGFTVSHAQWQWHAIWQRQRVRTTVPTSPSIGPWLAGTPDEWGSIKLSRTHGFWRPWVSVQAVGAKPGDHQNSFQAPGYGLVHLGSQWLLHPKWQLNARVGNALDKRYISNVQALDYAWQGPRRTWMIEIEGVF